MDNTKLQVLILYKYLPVRGSDDQILVTDYSRDLWLTRNRICMTSDPSKMHYTLVRGFLNMHFGDNSTFLSKLISG